jgi:SAM-dependent methyltransferase
MFYNPRLDDADLRRLYGNYRSKEYQQMRHASEPWYTTKFNADLASPTHYKTRRAKLGPILQQHIGERKISRILDYGGDRGDLLVGLFKGAEAFVYDISGIPAAAGVTSTPDPASCKADLIINSNVLEHVGFPRLLVSEILNASPEGGLVYLEVPCEFPFGLTRIARRLAQIGVIALTRPALAQFVLRPASLHMMHEHINYFSERSLTTLMRSSGANVIAAGSYPLSARAGKGDMAWCLGQKQ